MSLALDQILKIKAFWWIMPLLHGLLMFAGWPLSPFPFFLFIGFVPLLILDAKFADQPTRKNFFRYWGSLYLGFLVWNVSTTWWVINASLVGGIAAFVLNSLLMTIPFLLYSLARRAGGLVFGLISLATFWITFEYIHLNWDMSWPWLNLGNGLARYPQLIQWYAFTGTTGGTIWILLINFLVFLSLSRIHRIRVYLIRLGLIILIPVVYSVIQYLTYEQKGTATEVVVLQPNINPYTEKFEGLDEFIPFPEQIRRFISLSESMITENTDFLVWPETALDKWIMESQLARDQDVQMIEEFKRRHPGLSLITGVTTYTVYGEEKHTPTARHSDRLGYYDSFNTAFFLGDNGARVTYHKSKLVPGVEIMPYPALFNFLIELVFDLGGTTGGYGRQQERTVFVNADTTAAAPSICYESIYGDFMSEYVRNGAELIFIITNDGWWGDTPGYRQHMQYAVMRAIETRRSIARSANTGISGFINQRGDIIERTEYWEQDVRRNTIKANDELTFYARYGDYLARTSSWLSVFLILGAIVKLRQRK